MDGGIGFKSTIKRRLIYFPFFALTIKRPTRALCECFIFYPHFSSFFLSLLNRWNRDFNDIGGVVIFWEMCGRGSGGSVICTYKYNTKTIGDNVRSQHRACTNLCVFLWKHSWIWLEFYIILGVILFWIGILCGFIMGMSGISDRERKSPSSGFF